MKFTPLLIGLSLLISVIAGEPARAGDCLDRFRAAVQNRTLEEKRAITMKLQAKEIHCLVRAAGNDSLDPDFFLEAGDRATKRVQRFAGKNSLPVGKYFEKHFFGTTGDPAVYGYNEAKVNHLLQSPGFFEILPNERDRGTITFDYRGDFVKRLRAVDLGVFSGATVATVKNNRGNLIFGELVDVMKKIDADIAVGYAAKKGKTQSAFIIVRLPVVRKNP